MEQYWATQGAQHLDYDHSEKYGAYDSFQHGEQEKERRDNDIKSEHNWFNGSNSDLFAKQTPERGNIINPETSTWDEMPVLPELLWQSSQDSGPPALTPGEGC